MELDFSSYMKYLPIKIVELSISNHICSFIISSSRSVFRIDDPVNIDGVVTSW